MKWPQTIMEEARDESYEDFDKNIRSLSKDQNGNIDPIADGLVDNDIDAFRHAFVSGVFAIEYNELAADILGRMNEYMTPDLYSNSKDPRSLNMDLWNNKIGRDYAKKFTSREDLLKQIHQALIQGELIISLEDDREYKGSQSSPLNKSKPVIVLKENKQGRNEVFFDLILNKVLTREEFVTKIKDGEYKDYFIKVIHGVDTPFSKPDSRQNNNLE